jgi:amidase
MKISEYIEYDGLGLAELMRDRQVHPDEVLQAARHVIQTLNPELGAVVDAFDDEPDVKAPAESGSGKTPLAGVPFLIKDLGLTCAGKRSTMGSRLFEAHVARADSELMLRYRRAGLVTLGKTNLPELGLSFSTEPELFGPCRNPWNPTHTPGGSSGGAAAAVAARMVPIAHGSDAAGSIRVPASACGLFGFKPTRGRNPTGPFAGEIVFGLGVEHVLTRSVRDSAATLDATAGEDIGPPYGAPTPQRPFLAEVSTPPGRLRIALCDRSWSGEAVSPECIAAVTSAARRCEDLGHDVVPACPDSNWSMLRHALGVLLASFASQIVDVFAPWLGVAVGTDGFGKLEASTRALVEKGRQLGARDLATALAVRDALARGLGQFFTKFDLLLTPTMAVPPPLVGSLGSNDAGISADVVLDRLLSVAPFTAPFNLAGTPAMSVPLHVAKSGLPVGVQLAAGWGADALLFRMAGQLERASPWMNRKPACVLNAVSEAS